MPLYEYKIAIRLKDPLQPPLTIRYRQRHKIDISKDKLNILSEINKRLYQEFNMKVSLKNALNIIFNKNEPMVLPQMLDNIIFIKPFVDNVFINPCHRWHISRVNLPEDGNYVVAIDSLEVESSDKESVLKYIDSHTPLDVSKISSIKTHRSHSDIKEYYNTMKCEVCGREYLWIDDLVKRQYCPEYYCFSRSKCKDCKDLLENNANKEWREKYGKQLLSKLMNDIDTGNNWIDKEEIGSRFCIYYIYNPKTNEGYIGQTKRYIAFRWNQHINNWIGDPTGWHFTVLEYWESTDDAIKNIDEREAYWIHQKEDEGVHMLNKVLYKNKRKKSEYMEDLLKEVPPNGEM